MNNMKFRRLHKEELQELEKEFVQFLATNSITSDEWEKMKKEENEKAEKIIDIFSDMVFQSILSSVDLLELKEKQEIKFFKFLDEKVKMIGIKAEGTSDLDFTQPDSPNKMMEQLHASGAQLKLLSAEKKYAKEKELEIFAMMEAGCLISKDSHLYDTLVELKQQASG